MVPIKDPVMTGVLTKNPFDWRDGSPAARRQFGLRISPTVVSFVLVYKVFNYDPV